MLTDSRPDDAIGRRQVIQEFGGRMLVVRDDRNIQRSSRALICLAEGH